MRGIGLPLVFLLALAQVLATRERKKEQCQQM